MKAMTTRRKLAMATWAAPKEGNIYGKLTLDVTQVLKYIEWAREQSGERISITHVVACAVGRALAEAPGLNGRILFGKYIPHDFVDVAFLVALEEGADLAKAKVEKMDQKTPAEVAAALREKAQRLREGKDDDFEKSKGAIRALPTWLLRPLIWLTGWLASAFGANVPALGVTAYPFGSAIITSVGMFGLDEGYVPPTPFARVPCYVLIGAVTERAVVIDGELAIRPMMTITATLDHRFIDGFQGGVLAKKVRSLFANPWQLDGLSEMPAEVA